MIWLCLLACGGTKPADTAVRVDTATATSTSTPPTTTASGSTTPPTIMPDVLTVPAPAEDLDPAPEVLRVQFRAAPHTYTAAGVTVDGFAYNGQVPGPTLRAEVGTQLVVELVNDLDTATTIHWHGPRDVPFAMDGVPWLSEPVPPGGRFEYSFTLTHAGTFWYHPHFDTERQVDLGLYGALVVEDSAEPTTDHDQVWVFDAMGEEAAGDLHHHGFEPLPSQWTVNGQDNPLLAVTGGEVVRARLINVSNTGYLRLTWPDARQIAGGQGLLPSPVPVEELVLGPGERAEIELTPGESEQVLTTLPHSLAGPSAFGDPSPLVTLARTGAAPVTGPEWGSGPLSPSPDPGTTDVVYVFQGDERTGEWRINGEAFPEVTIETLPLGADAVIEVRNLSPSHHPFHLHGLHFELLSRNGVAPPQVMVADTLDLAVRDVVRLRVVADNPGDWMAHCHILPHAEGGMMTVLRVE